jgi:1-phosphofructokinase
MFFTSKKLCENVKYVMVQLQNKVTRRNEKMIVTVTMNPAVDKTVVVDTFQHHGLNRVQRAELDAGGKGINVSKTIRELGGQSVAIGFLGGHNGQFIEHALEECGITTDFVWVSGETRTNTKIVEKDGTLTELNEPGFLVSTENIAALKKKLIDYANEETMFVFAGSIPRGVSKDIYKELICAVKGKGAYVLLDADGEVLRNALEAKPNVVKPNKAELVTLLGMDENAGCNELIAGAKSIQQKGVEHIVVSMGKDGAIFLIGNESIVCESLPVKVSSCVGAGDAMVAAFAYAWEKGLGQEETIRLCMATSAGAVTTSGTRPPSKEVVQELMR